MLRSHWYTAVASVRLKDAPFPVRVLDKDLVVFRDSSGRAHAIADRCCHRGYRLSCGRVVDDKVECGYHGWRFDGDGQCAYIPSLRSGASIPKAFSVPRYPCVEVDGYVWVWMAKDGEEPHYQPSIPEFAGGQWLQGAVDVACDAVKAIEVSLDFHHVYYVHPSLPQSQAWRAHGEQLLDTTGEVRLVDRGFVYFWPPTDSLRDPIPEHAPKVSFKLPNIVRLEWPMGGGNKQFHYFFIVPTGPRSCRMEHLLPRHRPGNVQAEWSDEASRVVVEDKELLEVIQNVEDTHHEDDFVERSVEVDVPCLIARRMVKMAETESWGVIREKLGERKIFSYRAGPR